MSRCQWLATKSKILREKIGHFTEKTEETKETTRILKGLYDILTVLDAKASGLLSVNSIFIAVLAVFLGWLINNNPPRGVPSFWHGVAWLDGAAFVISSFLCLCVVRVSWSFYGKAVKVGAKYTFDAELDPLARAVALRTVCYQCAWWTTLGALTGFVFLALVVLSRL